MEGIHVPHISGFLLAEGELEEGLLKALPVHLPLLLLLLLLLLSHLLLSLHLVVAGGQAPQLASQGLEDGKSVTLVADQGLVQPGEGGEPGGEVVHLAPPCKHLGTCSRASFQQGRTLSLAICNNAVTTKFTSHM